MIGRASDAGLRICMGSRRGAATRRGNSAPLLESKGLGEFLLFFVFHGYQELAWQEGIESSILRLWRGCPL